MVDSAQRSGNSSVKARLKQLNTDISTFIDSASEGQQRILLSLLDDRRLLDLLQDPPQANRRNHPRRRCSIAVDCSSWRDAFKGLVQDISLGGMFILCIETDKVLSVGEQITVNFPTLPNKQEPIEVPAEVVWTAPEGIGVKFTTTSSGLEEILASQ